MAKPHIKLRPLTAQEIERFWKKVDKTPGQGPQGECWTWTAALDKNQYGISALDGRNIRAARVALFLATGTDLGPLLACHTCDFPPCVRADHLFEAPPIVNSQDMVRKGRHAVGAKNGTYTHPESRSTGDKNGSRRYPERLPRGAGHYSHHMPDKTSHTTVNGIAKFTDAQINQMKNDVGQGIPKKVVCSTYHVSRSHLWNLLSGRARIRKRQ